jgi:hypothetical protein
LLSYSTGDGLNRSEVWNYPACHCPKQWFYTIKFLIIGIFAAIVAFLIWRSKQNTAPEEQACAIEIGSLLKANPGAQPQVIADVFRKHGVDQSRCKDVGAMVMPQLRKQGLKPEDARIVMGQVRAAYPLVP